MSDFNLQDTNLSVRSTVVLNQKIEDSITAVRPLFATLPSEVTSGIRTPEAQLHEAILYYAQKEGIANLFPEFVDGLANASAPDVFVDAPDDIYTNFGLAKVYWWQRTWSHLLNKGVIINPCFQAIVLEDYTDAVGIQMKGKPINQTNHATGNCYDIGGGTSEDLERRYLIMEGALRQGIGNIHSLTLEKVNDCVHVNLNV